MASRRQAWPALPAYMLHRYDWSETSLIVELFTRERGRVVAAAKGAKRPTSQLRPVLLPLQPLLVTLGREPADAEREIHNLRGAEWGGGPPMPGGEALMSGLYLNELLLKLLARHDPHPTLFDAYAYTVRGLGLQQRLASSAALRAFELVLLRELGWLPELDRVTASQQVLSATKAYRLDPERGLVSTAETEPGLSGQAWGALACALAANDLGELQRSCAPVSGALRSQSRAMLDYHLGTSWLRTRRVMLDLQRMRVPASEQAP